MRIPLRKFISLIMLTALILFFAQYKDATAFQQLCQMSTFVLICAAVILYVSNKKLTGGILYYACLVFMHCGQVFIIAFDMEFSQARQSSISIGNTLSLSHEAVYFTTVCCLIVALIVCLFEKTGHFDINESEPREGTIRLSGLGWAAVLGICVLAVVSDFVRIGQVAALGYGLGFQQTNTFLYYADLLFPLAMFLVISIYKNQWKVLVSVLGFIIVRAGVIAFLIGSRSNAVLDIMISSFAIVKLTNRREIRKRTFWIVGGVFLAGIIILPFTGLLRNVGSLTIGEFLEKNNPISYSLTEFGGTIINVRLGIEYMHSLSLGTFFSSFLSIIPLSGFLFSSLISVYGGTYSTYLNTVHGGGLGGSIIGEAAFWFGNAAGGYVFIVCMALVVVFVLNRLEKVRRSYDFIAGTVLLFFLYDMFYYIRGAVASLQGGLKIAIYFWLLLHFAKKYLFIESRADEIEKGELHKAQGSSM